MSENLEQIFSKAANSNLTASALEFVPRSTNYVNVRPSSSHWHCNGKFHRFRVKTLDFPTLQITIDIDH